MLAELRKVTKAAKKRLDRSGKRVLELNKLFASRFIKDGERKSADTAQFIRIVRKYSDIPKLTPEIMHEFIEKIVVHAPDKSSGHRTQQIDICFHFNVLTATVTADRAVYGKKRKAA